MADEPDRWRRSSRCEAHNCVEIVLRPEQVLVRSSRHPGQIMAVTPTIWRSFCLALRAGQLAG